MIDLFNSGVQIDEALHDSVRASLKAAIKQDGRVEVDMADFRSMSPSVAYNVFAKLADEWGEVVREKLIFLNDSRGHSQVVWSAIARRMKVIASERSESNREM